MHLTIRSYTCLSLFSFSTLQGYNEGQIALSWASFLYLETKKEQQYIMQHFPTHLPEEVYLVPINHHCHVLKLHAKHCLLHSCFPLPPSSFPTEIPASSMSQFEMKNFKRNIKLASHTAILDMEFSASITQERWPLINYTYWGINLNRKKGKETGPLGTKISKFYHSNQGMI